MLYYTAVFLSSFLSFSLQLMVGKIFLPWFGGSSSVWTTLLFYFTTFLLFGYLYVFFLAKLPTLKQKTIHLNLLKITIFALAIILLIFSNLFPENPNQIIGLISSPSLQIILLATISIGLPYFVTSTTSTLLQLWYSYTYPKKSPYFLYTFSNVGSLLGLLSYPFLVEPNLTLHTQETVWVLLFLAFLGVYYQITKKLISQKISVKNQPVKVSKQTLVPWILLATISNISLLSTTSTITLAISPTPFLWLIPLVLFLLSFILGFSEKIYQRSFHLGLLAFTLLVVLANFNNYLSLNSYWSRIGLLLFAQFMINFVCHAELYKSRPKADTLPYFYLSIAIGGVIGSLFCAFVAPNIFNDFYEFLLGVALSISLLLIVSINSSKHWPQIVQHIFISTLLAFLFINHTYNTYIKDSENNSYKTILKQRNFYGVIKIKETLIQSANSKPHTRRTLFNGNIDHGFQNLDGQFIPTIYYSPESGIGQYFQNLKHNKNLRIGVVGLGTGALAGYCKSGDYFRFYEINPLVKNLNGEYFTFTKNCENLGGAVDIIMGDARLSLEKELIAPQKLDILVIDAFTDDAIPIHLMTDEALQIYLKHLSPNGVVAFHISNLHLNLSAVLNSLALKNDLYTYIHSSNGSQWYFVSSAIPQNNLSFNKMAKNLKTIRPWTDDYSNLLDVLK